MLLSPSAIDTKYDQNQVHLKATTLILINSMASVARMTALILISAIFFLSNNVVDSFVFRSSFHGKTLSTIQQQLNRASLIELQAEKNIFEMYAENVDNDDSEAFQRIVGNYLKAKFSDCHGDDCRMFCDRNEVTALLKTVLPPVSSAELDVEVQKALKSIGAGDDDLIEADSFLNAVVANTFWSKAGPLVVKEMIFLDCLYEYYFREKRSILANDDYNDLKEMLTWEGSAVVSMNAKEAQFVISVATSKRGQGTLIDSDYDKLKSELLAAQSWVVTTKQDPLEKMGIETFLGYLHRSF